MSRVDVVDLALERVHLDLFNARGVVFSLQLAHLLFWNLWKSLEIEEIWGVGGSKCLRNFGRFELSEHPCAEPGVPYCSWARRWKALG